MDYIVNNLSSARSGKINRVFPGANLKVHPTMMFLDIETTGLSPYDMVNTVSIARLNGDLKVNTYFTIDPESEEAVISKVLDEILSPSTSLFTYNGKSFDISRLNERAVAWGAIDKAIRKDGQSLLLPNYASPARMALQLQKNAGSSPTDHQNYLEFLLNGRHQDLMDLFGDFFKRQVKEKPRDGQLQTLEKIIPEFGVHRKNEILGREIPGTYRRFIYEGDNEKDVARIIEHNVLDTITLTALLTYLCVKEESKKK